MDTQETVELESLAGEHMLTGVDRGSVQIKHEYSSWVDNCEVIRFTLDGKTYTVVEDPEDGYRSSARAVTVSDETLENTFSPVKVRAEYISRFSDEHSWPESMDIISLVSVDTGKQILRAGTGNIEDYYPYFVCEYDPTALPQNQTA